MPITHDDPKSIWLDTASKHIKNPQLNGEITCDVAIIGGGFTGLSAALKLLESGTSIALLEANDIGFGASGRNGGQVNPMMPFVSPERLHQLVGSTYFERLTHASLNSADHLFNLIKKYDIQCQPRQKGWLRVDHCKKALATSLANAESWNRFGAKMQSVMGDELQKLTGSPLYQSGILNPKGGAIHPFNHVQELARIIKEMGGQIYGHSRATVLIQQEKGWVIKTAKGKVKSQWVIVATDGYSDGLVEGLEQSVMPLSSIQIASDSLSDEQVADVLPQGQTISDTRRVIMYARREADNRVIFGSHGKLKSSGELVGFEWLVKDVTRIFPQLAGVNWRYRWGGKFAITHDRIPHFHEPARGMVAGLGYNGRGVAISHVMGEALADRVLGKAAEALPFPISKISKIPFRNVQLLGKSSAIKYMQFLDRLESN